MPLDVKAKVLIYTKSRCGYCVRAKDLLALKGAECEEINLDQHPEIYAELKARTGWMTVPQIFINGEMIGGYDELAALERANRLDALLAETPSER